VSVKDGNYRILGRISQDIIKKAGYKISALDIEAMILEMGTVQEVCVLGIPD
jgi:malonyl-CoA/methylmalonyl-CoA synthetase